MGNSTSTNQAILSDEEKAKLSGYDWPFENLVFEGGGAKCISAIGTLRVLEELGVLQKIKRFAGTSGGALLAALAVVGYNSHEIEKIISINLKEKSEDALFGVFSYIPNLVFNFGMHSGDNLNSWLGKVIQAKTSDPDITFYEMYRKTGKELAVTVTDIMQMDAVYCHVKTTPSMPIRKALRMSMGIPGVMQPVIGENEACVDGGVLCNYPIKSFDGWFLSMAPEDSFLLKFQGQDGDLASLWDVKNKFGTCNIKTVGVIVYTEDDDKMFKTDLEERKKKHIQDQEIPPRPRTTIAKQREKQRKKREDVLKKHSEMSRAMVRFVKCLAANDKDISGTTSKEEFKAVITKDDSEFTADDAALLFGTDTDVDEHFDKMDLDNDGEISFLELTTFAEQKGLKLMTVLRSGARPDKITDVGKYFEAIVDTFLVHIRRIYVQEEDIERTIGIDTAYLGTMDFGMANDDKQFLIQQGKIGCLAFLRHYIKSKKLEKSKDDPTVHPKISEEASVNGAAVQGHGSD